MIFHHETNQVKESLLRNLYLIRNAISIKKNQILLNWAEQKKTGVIIWIRSIYPSTAQGLRPV